MLKTIFKRIIRTKFLGILFILSFNFSINTYSQDSIKVYFLYGSKPAAGFSSSEKHLFGGLHGGHVSIGIDSIVYGFHHLPGLHIFPYHHHLDGVIQCQSLELFQKDTISNQYVTFTIPVTDLQFNRIKEIYKTYVLNTPYDYAFFGMRCTASAYDVLCKIGLFPVKSRFAIIRSNFYPKMLRKKMYTLCACKHYPISFKKGRSSRKWEKD